MQQNLINFNYVGCFRSIGTLENNNTCSFSIDMGIEAPYLKNHLVPQLNSIKHLEREEVLDLSFRNREKYIDNGAGEKLETILSFIQKMETNERNLRERIGCEFVCGRGLLVKLSKNCSVDFRAVRRKDVIFLCVTSQFYKYDKNSHISMKFEKSMTEDPYYMQATNNMRVIWTGIRTKIVNQLHFVGTDLSVLSSAETDSRNPNDDKIVELKMTRKPREIRKHSLKEYMQCFLSNTDYILTASLKDENRRLEIYELEMEHRDHRMEDFGEVESGVARIRRNLEQLRNLLSENDRAIHVRKITENGLIYDEIEADDCEFVPDDFLVDFE
ncbi:unnamed protein product [Caenorhabditis angaria]|uniref:Decapping nuclease n=1 Tax=Caenorhabditis angaria TaxID=860376 RepID=A0A9P1I1Z7_9PELO|nr:unnamed protein product [Caenorhabditis angaria]